MQKYPVRATARAGLTPEALERICREVFGEAHQEGGKVRTSFGALAALATWREAKELAVEVTMNPKVEASVAQDTVRRYNQFLQSATGYSAKERAARLRKSASKGAGGE